MDKQVPAVSLRHITKAFGSKVVANKDVSMDIMRGEILSLLGENGSGKTTLMNMLSGIYHQDSGQILVDGNEVFINSPKDAYALGIGMIHQHFKLVDVFTATENVALGMDKKVTGGSKEIAKAITEICDRYGFDVDPKKKVYNMIMNNEDLSTIDLSKYAANIQPSILTIIDRCNLRGKDVILFATMDANRGESNIKRLEEKVKAKGLEWYKLDEVLE